MIFTKCRITATLGAVGLLAVVGQAGAAAFFDGFVDSMKEVCNDQPSTSCAFAVKNFLDADGDGSITYEEVIQARDEAQSSMKSQEGSLDPEARGIVAVALLVTQDSQLPGVFNNFDTNGDGGLDDAELFADFNLDQRPFADVIADPNGVDWNSFATRFGPAGMMILAIIPPEYR